MTTTTTATAKKVAPPSAGRESFGAKAIKRFAGYAFLIFFAIIYLYPFFIQISTSFKTDADAANNPTSLVPDPFTTAAWERLFDGSSPFPTWFGNSVFVTICITVGRVFFNSLAGYALSRLKFRGKEFLFITLLAIMSVPGVVLLIPRFLVLTQLGIWNTYTAMVLPMARPALLTVTILSFQGSWNEFTHFLVAIQDPELFTLTLGLAQITTGSLGSGTQFPLRLAAALVTTIPVAIMFFAFQRKFVQGASEGGVKG